VLKCLAASTAVVIALAVAVGISLRQPTPLTVPPQGVALAGVTVVNPGLERRADQLIVVEGSTCLPRSRRISGASEPMSDDVRRSEARSSGRSRWG
jgi:hypothetical protein